MLNVHVLQHVPYEGLGNIESWVSARGGVVSCTHFFDASPALPEVDDFDLLVVLGGPMSVNDEDALPWLVEEKRFIARVMQSGKPVLGICLGAQLIANVLGAKVYAAKQKEIGWFPVEAVPHDAGAFRFADRMKVFHWHGETFDLPPGAVHLARSCVCENQSFQIGANVIGLQFHLETTPESLEAIVANSRDELAEGEFIQSEAEMRDEPLATYGAINGVMNKVLGYLVK